MKNNFINNMLKYLEDNCFEYLKLSSEYSYDHHIESDDYSKEYIYSELFKGINNYSRAINTLDLNDKLKDRIKFINDNTMETLSMEDQEFSVRLMTFFIDYFSKDRYHEMISDFQSTIDFESLSDLSEDSADLMENEIITLFDFRDHIDQLCKEDNIFYSFMDSADHNTQNYRITMKKLKDDISLVHNDHLGLWSLFKEILENYRETLFIPHNTENEWWFNLQPLTVPKMKNALNSTAESLLYKYLISDLTKNSDIKKEFNYSLDQISDLMSDTFGKMGKKYNNVIYPIPAGETTTPSLPTLQSPSSDVGFATWGEQSDVAPEDQPQPRQSDHRIADEAFAHNYFVNKQAIYQAIEVMSSSEVDEQLRKETIALLLILVDENQKAFELLND